MSKLNHYAVGMKDVKDSWFEDAPSPKSAIINIMSRENNIPKSKVVVDEADFNNYMFWVMLIANNKDNPIRYYNVYTLK